MQSAVCANCSGGRCISEALPSPHDLRDLPRTVREVPSSPVACRQESGGLRVNASRYHGSPSLEFPGTDKRRSVSGVSGEAESHKVPVKTYSPRRMRTLNAIRFHTGTTKNGTRLFTPADLDFRNSGRWSWGWRSEFGVATERQNEPYGCSALSSRMWQGTWSKSTGKATV